MAHRFIVERNIGGSIEDGNLVELDADIAEQDQNSSRVTFYMGSEPNRETVGSFINVSAWYRKPAA